MVEEDEGYTKKFCLIVCFKLYFSLHPDMNSDISNIKGNYTIYEL